MVAVKTAFTTNWDTHLIEWALLDDAEINPFHVSFPDHPEMTVQLLEIAGTTPSIVAEFSNNVDPDSTKVWGICNDMQGTPISLVLAGDGALIQESGILMRLRVAAGSSVIAKGRIKFTRTR